MKGNNLDISAIIVAHHEGVSAGPSLASMIEAADFAGENGLNVELLAVLDTPSESTVEMLSNREDLGLQTIVVEHKDQGKTRNHAVAQANGQYLAFLDADDLWGFNWLVEAHKACQLDTRHVIAHPEINWLFGDSNNIFVHVDQNDDSFDPEFLRVANYWDALCMAHRSIYEQFPFCERRIEDGFAYEDWNWSCVTLEAGIKHQSVPNTIHFKHRREGSQGTHSLNRRAIPPPSALFRYSWYQNLNQTTITPYKQQRNS